MVSVGLAATLALSGGVVADVATSHNTSQAQAYSVTTVQKWQTDRYWNGVRWMCGVWQYRDYDWFEESWFGGSHKDGWYRVYYAYC